MQLSHLLSLLPLAGLALADTVATAQAEPKPNKASMVAFGIGTNNFTRSYDFYTKIIGLTDTGISLPTDMFDETILAPPGGGSGFLLMQFKPRREVTNLPVKIVLGLPDVASVIKKIKTAGYKIILEPDPILQLAFAEDPDGYLLEFNQSG